jgi:hypothetical protein
MVTMTDFIKLLREKYKRLEPVFCPYTGQLVYFNSKGLKHLIWKSELGIRNQGDIFRRFQALDIVHEILSKSGTLQEYEKEPQEFLCFVAIIKNKKYKVVITRGGDGMFKFVSVIPNWKRERGIKSWNEKIPPKGGIF